MNGGLVAQLLAAENGKFCHLAGCTHWHSGNRLL